jgi:DNA-binding GntR family transcriptional regulator
VNAGPTSERVYAALKRLILARRFRPGEKLDPGRLADALGSSVTPVRDALHLLTGEGLVEMRTSDGYAIPLIDEPGLRDLYRWSAAVLQLAARADA